MASTKQPTPAPVLTVGPGVFAGGAVGIAAGLAALAARHLGVINGTRWGTLQWSIVMTAAGLALATGGSMSLRRLWRSLRPTMTLGWFTAVAVVVWGVAGAIEWKSPPVPRSPAPLVAAAGLTLGALVLGGRRRWPRGRTMVSGVLAGLVALFATAGYLTLEQYPFAPFRMYSQAQLDPRTVTLERVVGTTMSGGEVDLTGTFGTATVRGWIDRDDPEGTAAAVAVVVDRHQSRSGVRLREVSVVVEEWTVVPYPGPAEVTLAEEEVVLSVDLDR